MNLKAHVTTTLQKGIRRVAVVAYTSPCTTQFVREETKSRSCEPESTRHNNPLEGWQWSPTHLSARHNSSETRLSPGLVNLKAHVTTTLQKGVRRVAVVAYTSQCTTQLVRDETKSRSCEPESTRHNNPSEGC